MTYLQYIFSDKKSAVYWILTFILFTILTILRVIVSLDSNSNLGVWDYLLMFIYLIIFFVIYLGFYASGYLKYKLQERFKVCYKSIIERNSIHEVVIHYDKLTVKPLSQSFDVKVLIPPRKDYYQLCKIGDSLIILGHVYDFGVFKRHMRPLQIDINNSKVDRLKFAIKPSIYDININNKDLELKFKKSVSGINKLVIKDFK